ncbi:hypothetical protein ECANGB1_2376 [Enterospora canceri]|uniref:Uncharacterized protein n=1 Tax=Enterospora canceri TaxID=1081671 RepID=A0A1Y1S5G2_9MICR|nr:hypothetical protein ECANGB1_2376 [Enterospora canceri]
MRTKLMSKRTEQQEIAHHSCLYQTYEHTIVFICKKMLIATKYDYQAYSTEFEGIKHKDNEYHKTKSLFHFCYFGRKCNKNNMMISGYLGIFELIT